MKKIDFLYLLILTLKIKPYKSYQSRAPFFHSYINPTVSKNKKKRIIE
jgi:hypothetical protein